MVKLGVNIDHIATLRQARRAGFPDPVKAARICEKSGCDSIVCHLREDRRHIQDADVFRLKESVRTRLNLEMSVASGIVEVACMVKPDQATLVPERRQEVTTEGGLDVDRNEAKIKKVVSKLLKKNIAASLFINPSKSQIDASVRVGAPIIELHTGEYANARLQSAKRRELEVLKRATKYAISRGLEVNAGHGLDYDNVKAVVGIEGINELNIGYSIISRAVFAGLGNAVSEMLELIRCNLA